MQKPIVGIVVPSIRKECINKFFEEWYGRFFDNDYIVNFYLIEDNTKRSFKIDKTVQSQFNHFRHYSHKEIKQIMGKNSWIIPFKSDCVRSFGYYMAWEDGCDYTITLDDDCYPYNDGTLDKHIENLNSLAINNRWENTIEGEYPRGFPYGIRNNLSKVVISHGLWHNVPDLDGPTQLIKGNSNVIIPEDKIIPINKYYPQCGMNLAWRKDMTKYMYFLLMGKNYPFDRFGDIWAGIIAKKVCDVNGWSVHSGHPFIHHSKASNVFDNLIKEAKGIKANEVFWEYVDSAKGDPETIYLNIADKISEIPYQNEYFKKLSKAMYVWYNLFD